MVSVSYKDKSVDTIKIIMDKLKNEFQTILDLDPQAYSGYTFIITNEQQYVKEVNRKNKTLYIVVKFLQGSNDFGQLRQPFSITATSEHDGITVCQKLMYEFANTYNLAFDFDEPEYTLRQVTSTPSVVSNFNEVYEGFRSVFYISGAFIFGFKTNSIVKIEIDGEDVDFISAQFSYNGQPDSQPFFDTNNFNRTVVKISSFSLGFSIYATDTPYYNKFLDIVFNKDNSVNIDRTFSVHIVLKSGKEYTIPMKFVQMNAMQEVRDFPATSITLAR